MGQATKGGMYCARCDKPVAATKTTHGVRNTSALFTMGMTGKIEDWHCPDCGGKVETAWIRDMGERSTARRKTKEAAHTKNVLEDPTRMFGVAVKAFEPGRARKVRLICQTAIPMKGEEKALHRKAMEKSLEDLPALVDYLTKEEAFKLQEKLTRLGAEAEVFERRPDEAVEDKHLEALRASTPAKEPRPEQESVSRVASGADVPEQIKKLGELRESGLLTEEEFQAKKAELLARM